MKALHFLTEYWLETFFFSIPIIIGIQAVIYLRRLHLKGVKRKRLLIERSKNNMYTQGFAEGTRLQIEYVKTMDSEQFYEFFNK